MGQKYAPKYAVVSKMLEQSSFMHAIKKNILLHLKK